MKHLLLLLSMLLMAAIAQAKGSPNTPAILTAANSPKDLACQETYHRLFAKGSVNIRLVFGYKDARPARFVGDRHERIAFVQRILAECPPGRSDCEFSRDDDNADLFFKNIFGPDGQPVRVNLFVAQSSAGSDDAANREDPFQKWRSVYARKAFFEGISKADIVLYNGHSRFGGGPDFEPPRLAKNGDVDAGHYMLDKPGLQMTRKKLRERARLAANRKDGLKMLGLFSCASSQHFAQEVLQDSDAGFVSSNALIYYADALESSLVAISATLEMRCERDFKSALRQDSNLRSSQLQGFFPRRH